MVAPVERDTSEWKSVWKEARKAVCIWKEPVPQTDTGRQEEDSKASGRRGAYEGKPQRIGPSDCLAKTQLYAKSKDDVYGVTPARCWKVKRRCESIELKPQ